jgi:tripartite-type tricarboxylate transporter receptor subunit TctC
MLKYILNRPLAQQNIARAATYFVALVTLIGWQHQACAQAAWPTKPVTIIVPFAAGGGTDLGARLIAQKLTAKWGQSVVVDNKGGAGGIVGVEAAVRSKPDGYTLLVGNVGTQSINPALYKKLPYDHDKAFAPISLIAELPFFVLASPGLPVKNITELIALARAEPGKISYASSGNGGSPHLSGEIFQALSGTKLLHVPYKGGGPAMTDLMAGHVNLLFASVLESIGHVKSGKLKALAVTTTARSAAMPDVPTVADSGLPGYESGSWIALLAPAGTPKDLVDKIAADVKAVLEDEPTRQALIGQGAAPRSSTPAQLAALIDADRKRYTKIISDKSISLD